MSIWQIHPRPENSTSLEYSLVRTLEREREEGIVLTKNYASSLFKISWDKVLTFPESHARPTKCAIATCLHYVSFNDSNASRSTTGGNRLRLQGALKKSSLGKKSRVSSHSHRAERSHITLPLCSLPSCSAISYVKQFSIACPRPYRVCVSLT